MGFVIYFIIGLIFLGIAASLWKKDGAKMSVEEAIIFIIIWPVVIFISLGVMIEEWFSDKSK